MESKILINKEVVNINWDGDVITVRCLDDSEYSADYVIFTASLGVLKDRHASLFTPPLPDNKVSTIENSEYGSLEKIFLEFSEPFWDTSDNFSQYSILWTQQDIHELVGTPQEWLVFRNMKNTCLKFKFLSGYSTWRTLDESMHFQIS